MTDINYGEPQARLKEWAKGNEVSVAKRRMVGRKSVGQRREVRPHYAAMEQATTLLEQANDVEQLKTVAHNLDDKYAHYNNDARHAILARIEVLEDPRRQVDA